MRHLKSFQGRQLMLGLLLCHLNLPQSQITLSENCAIADSCQNSGQNVRILFWNVENLFDYKDDTLTADEEFTGNGAMHWSYTKLQTKLAHVAKAILAAGEWDPPVIIGMCEIENRYVLNKLIYNSPLKSSGYRIIHRNSPDSRGIDVAMLYRADAFTPMFTEWITIKFPFDTTATTRDILYAKGILFDSDTIHLFVNHWPSRRGGEAASAPRRNYVASVLRAKIDSILKADTHYTMRNMRYAIHDQKIPDARSLMLDTTSQIADPSLLIMGDFNDEPENESLQNILKARLDAGDLKPGDLINMMHLMVNKEGSHKFREHWGLLDQFIVSGSLLDKQHPLQVDPGSVQIFKPAFLMEDDLKYLGTKPKRTYLGPRYKGGFSDHLPVVMGIRKLGN